MTMKPESAMAGAPNEGTKVSPKVVAAGVAAILALVFVFQNTQDAKIRFLWMSGNWPVWLALLLTLLVGFLVGYVVKGNRAKKK